MSKLESIAREIPPANPLDEHNRQLVENVHPPDWKNPEPAGRYNMVVIGAGTAGLVTAAGAAGLGAKVALIEKHLMGGDCLNVGCVPSKALISSARAIADVRAAWRLGVRVPDGSSIDFRAVMQRMRRLRAGISHHDSAKRFSGLGVDMFIGEAKFTGRDTVEVGGKTLRFAKACIATGARAAAPPIPGLSETGYLTNETVFSLIELPRRLAVIGGGPIGCELAQAFARFGSEVTLLEMGKQILGREDADAAAVIAESMARDGVRFVFDAKITSAQESGGQKILAIKKTGGIDELAVDEILVGAGRAPNVDGLGLKTAGVEFDRRSGVAVNDKLQTSNKNIYAAGDICFPYKFTHTADALARIVIGNALFWGRGKTSALHIPWCTYTDPEIAHVGLYERDAAQRGIALDTFTVGMDTVDRGVLEGRTEGFLKVHVKKDSDKIVGATLVAAHAGEMISEITLAITAGIGLGTIAKTIHPYPTSAEIIKKAADAYNRTRLTPGVKRLFDAILRWRR